MDLVVLMRYLFINLYEVMLLLKEERLGSQGFLAAELGLVGYCKLSGCFLTVFIFYIVASLMFLMFSPYVGITALYFCYCSVLLFSFMLLD